MSHRLRHRRFGIVPVPALTKIIVSGVFLSADRLYSEHMASGDVDGDGDTDIVVANDEAVISFARRCAFATAPGCSSAAASATHRVIEHNKVIGIVSYYQLVLGSLDLD